MTHLSGSNPARRAALPLLLASLALAAGCIDDLGSSTSSAAGPGGDVVPLEANPRVDLPGRVSVFFQVLGRESIGVSDLQGSDFELLENGTPVSQSESKQRLLAKPRVFRSYSMLLLDRSGSIAESPTGELEQIDAATAYIDLVTASPESFIALAWFDGGSTIRPLLLDDFTELGFSNNRDKLLEAIGNLHDQAPTSTSTNLYGAILRGLERLEAVDAEAAQQGIDFRSLTLVTFTDGSDQAGTTSLDQARTRLEEVDGTGRKRFRAFTIGLGGEVNQDALRQLGPDGSVFAQGFGDLTPQFSFIAQAVADVANSFYFLSYCSPKQDGSGMHTLTVRLRRPDLVASEDYVFSADYFSGGCGFVDFFEPFEDTGHHLVGDMQVDALGRVVIVGGMRTAGSDDYRLYVTRLRDDGTPDPSFGSQGRVVISQAEGLGSLRATAVDFDSDGSLIVGGIAGVGDLTAPDTRGALWRLDHDGFLLATEVLPAQSADADALNDLAVDSERRIVAVGKAGARSAVWRFLPDLLPDPGFSAPDGRFLREALPGSPGDEAVALALLPDDSFYVASSGRSAVFSGADLDLFKVLATGALDTSFSDDGIVRGHAFQAQVPGVPYALGVDSQGRVVVGGRYHEDARPPRLALWRLRPDGTPDPTFLGSPFSRFFGTGLVTLPEDLVEEPRILFHEEAGVADLVIHRDDSIVAAGMRLNAAGHTDVAMWRFATNGGLERAYNGTGFLIDDGALGPATNERATRVLIHPDGRIFTTGVANRAGADDTDATLGVWIDSEEERVFAPTGVN